MRAIDGEALYEKACDLEAQALSYIEKIIHTVINGAIIATPFPDKRRAEHERSDKQAGGD